MTSPLAAADRAGIDRWWVAFRADGKLPEELVAVQGRLIRSVHRGELPSGSVYVKAMTFPRAKDRLRYLLRELPGAHEARLLRCVAAAGIPCPAVVDCRTERRLGLPARSLLVLRALPVVAESKTARARLGDAIALTLRLLAAGIEHRDLHDANFVRLADGDLAVLDLQSASVCSRDLRSVPRVRLAVATRLLRDAPAEGLELAVAQDLVQAHEAEGVRSAIAASRKHYRRGRVWRCLQESTEFARELHWWGITHRRRRIAGPLRQVSCSSRMAHAAWLGERMLELDAGREPGFAAMTRNWWWLGGGAALYAPAHRDDELVQTEMRAASEHWWRVAAGADQSLDQA